ncbi:glycoside hydrolase family 43 protein [Niveispirillum irakense]|uniref:glycoside hydrolase family 43 protein n=1 Tax=Niveispirillum irakense TaxID=34011 RepID=UPI000419DF18|nr:glycoside hydrolase family 43 protein [Niveispirillum irakense]
MKPAWWTLSASLALALLASAPASTQTRVSEARFAWVEYQGADPSDAVATPGPGDYRNPILAGYYPDPSVTRVGEDYYLVTSTFTWFPGLPVFHSRDLVNWTQIGNAIDRPGMLDFKDLGLSRGVFAPAIEYHDGLFYIINTCVDCGGNFIITAKDPAGPWSDPVWLPDLEGGIDPSLFFDADGRAYIINNGPPEGEPLYSGHRALWIQEFDVKNIKTFGPRKLLVNGGVDITQKPVWIEGPHIFRKDGYYYLTAAEGGTAINHSQVAFRATSPMGPYSPGPNNPFLTQRDLPADRAHPITSAGHADLVQTQDGDWWATFLAVRPYRDDFYNTGRDTFLLPVRWVDGWPRMTEPGEAIALVHPRPSLPTQPAPAIPTSGPFTIRDDFDQPQMPLYWMTPRNPKGDWYDLTSHKGMLTLRPTPVGLSDPANPAFWARRQQHMNASITTELDFTPQLAGERAGLAAVQSNDYWYRLTVEKGDSGRVVRLAVRSGKQEPTDGRLIAMLPVTADGPLRLRITAKGELYDFHVAEADGVWRPVLTNVDGTILSTKRAGGFIGAMIGPFAERR